MTLQANIAIIGAGITGLISALALQREGLRPTLYEQAPELGEVGAGITLSPNATRVLYALGVGEALAAVSDPPDRQAVMHYADGHVLVDTPRDDEARFGAPYWHLHRADLLSVLEQAVRARDPGAILTNRRLTGIDQADGQVTLGFADGSSARADAAIAADGVKSIVREALFNPAPPRFMGQVAWRGLAPRAALEDRHLVPTSGVAMGPGRIFARYPIRGGALVNIVCIAAKDDWREEGWMIPASPQEVLAEFHDFHPTFREIIAAIPLQDCFRWALFARDPLERWVDGRIALIGDAAHGMLPFMGQGAAMGTEDAALLGRAFGASRSVEEALARYQAARLPRANQVMQLSTEQGERYQGKRGPGADGYSQDEHRNEESLGLFEYDAMTTPV